MPGKGFLLFLLFSHYVAVFHIFSYIYITFIYRCPVSKPPDHKDYFYVVMAIHYNLEIRNYPI